MTGRETGGQAKADQRARGRYLGGKRPFGFTVGEGGELVPDAAEQISVARMVAMRRRGKSLRAIAAAMAKRGHKLSVEGVRKVLRAAEERMASPRR